MGAAREAMKGKRRKVAGAKFFGGWEKECVDLREELMEERYRPGPYEYFKIYEPKERRVAAAPFRDRVLHHAVVRVLEPVFEKRFLEDSFACRKGKGTHAGMRRALNYAGKHPIALKCDIRKYFASIDHEILLKQLGRVVGDRRVLELCELIVGSHADGASQAWQGPGLFDVRDRRRGLPVGNLTSQFFANIYLDGLDHFIKQELRVPGYVRYVDDFVLFGSTAKEIKEWGKRVAGYLAGLRLELHPDKVRVCRTRDGVDFCGFVVKADGRVKVRRASVRRFARPPAFFSRKGKDRSVYANGETCRGGIKLLEQCRFGDPSCVWSIPSRCLGWSNKLAGLGAVSSWVEHRPYGPMKKRS
jgi:RNA-directed DNA polymerase